jgi:hypothetical protein
MATLLKKRRIMWASGILLLPLTVWAAAEAIKSTAWIGSTDLEIEFVVKDAATGESIPGAHICVCGERLLDDAKENTLLLQTDRVGRYHWFEKGVLCTGMSSWWRETCNVHLPDWYYWVSAPGYCGTTPRLVQGNTWRGKDRDYLTVEIVLQPRQP